MAPFLTPQLLEDVAKEFSTIHPIVKIKVIARLGRKTRSIENKNALCALSPLQILLSFLSIRGKPLATMRNSMERVLEASRNDSERQWLSTVNPLLM